METVLPYLADLISKTVLAVLESLAHNWAVLAFSIVTAVVLKTYVNTQKMQKFLVGRSNVSVFASVAVGAFTPFCACGTMAVIVGMLTTTLPWGPIMAFLTSSPLMSPDGFVMITGVLGLGFAIALTIASVFIGLISGFATLAIERRTGFLRDQSRYAKGAPEAPSAAACSNAAPAAPQSACGCGTAQTVASDNSLGAQPELGTPALAAAGEVASCCAAQPRSGLFDWKSFARKMKLCDLADDFVSLGLKQILLYFSIFVGVGYLVNSFVPTSIISGLFGAQQLTAVPLASLIGLPLYLTTESGIPIVQSLLASGASQGAMLAFLITGSATSAFVIAGLSTFMKKRAILLYVGYILAGGMICGWLYDLVLMFIK